MSMSRGIELAPLPLRERANALRAGLDARRDAIATLDGELEDLRQALARFEAYYHCRLAVEEERLLRLGGLVRHIERWMELLVDVPREQVATRARVLEQRRDREAAAWFQRRQERDAQREDETPEPPEAPGARGERPEALKAVYRALVRRYHPDLARTEEERLRCVARMQRINALYRAGDLGRLRALADREDEGDGAQGELPLAELVPLLEDRLAWFDAVLENLQEERTELERCDLHRLWNQAEEARARGGDFFAELEHDLQQRLERRRRDIAWAYDKLEQTVKRFNQQERDLPARRPAARREALERIFDPLADRPLVRLGLETHDAARARPAARRQAEWVESLPETDPSLLRLLLFAHVGELSHLPLPGLETYEDLKIRFESTPSHDPDAAPWAPLEETLAAAADLVEYGVRRATEQLVYLGLRFRSESTREAMPLALQAASVRRAFRDVLKVLGEQILCEACGQDTFAVPLFRTRGLDDLRATLCPICGGVQQQYYLPRGDDMQAVLNRAYVDLELVTEWSFRLARATVSTQLLPVEVESMSVGALKARLVQELLQRYDLGLTRGQVTLLQEQRRVPELTPLASLASTEFTVRFRPGAPVSEEDALELLRHRIRNRFT